MIAYKNCHDSDGIGGIIHRNTPICADKILYQHERKYESALRINSVDKSQEGIAQILNSMGCHDLLCSF